MKKLILKVLVIFLLVIVNFLSICMILNGSLIKLKGDNVVVNLNEEYVEPGYKANIFGINLKKNVIEKSDVDTSKVGEYQVDYDLNWLIFHCTKHRAIKVVDKIKPNITLIGNDEINLCPNEEYIEEGYVASDNYDGNLYDKVSISKYPDRIIYSVIDSSNNYAETIRYFKFQDEENPKITLKGKQTMSIYLGTEYKEPGYKVTDNCDDDLSVEIIGSVDTSKLGEYSLTYQVKDASGNTASVKRNVKVIKKAVIEQATIYLTFDDGPSLDTTPKILDILKQENIKATFFVTSINPDTDALIKRAYDEGHTIALHTNSHVYSEVYASTDAYFKDLDAIRNRVYQITGYYSNYIRFPGGSSNTVSKFNPGIMSKLATQVTEKGYIYFDWNVSSGDASLKTTKEKTYNNVINGLKKTRGNVVLMHDRRGNDSTAEALKDIIKYGKEQGYMFKPISNTSPTAHHGIKN